MQESVPHVRRAEEKRKSQRIQATKSATEREEERQRPHRTNERKDKREINNGCKCERELRKSKEVGPSKRPSATEREQGKRARQKAGRQGKRGGKS